MTSGHGAEEVVKPYTLELAKFVEELSFGKIPSAVVDTIKRNFLDSSGCGLFGSRLPWGDIISEFVVRQNSRGKASVWGKKIHTSPALAVLANGTMVHGYELDDVHKGGRVHPGAVCATSGLAIAEEQGGVDGKTLITALTAGYEITGRVARCVSGSHSMRGFHPEGTCGTFGAAATAAKLLNLDAGKIANALGLAGAQSAGLHAAQYGPMAKRFHAGRAAQSGVYAAELASLGFTGAMDILEKPYGGFCKAFADKFNLDALTAGLGKTYEAGKTGLKFYCGCGANQAALDAVGSFLLPSSIPSEQVEKIRVGMDEAALLHVGWKYTPGEVTGAQMNLSYNLAVLLLEGGCFVDQFRPEMLGDPRVLEIIAKKIQIVHDPKLEGRKGEDRVMEIEIHLKDGKKWQGTAWMGKAKGTPENPLTDAQVLEKFQTLALPAIGKEKARQLEKTVTGLEEIPDVSVLGALLQGS
jgi:2-methylcitrate dehydratase PrpD